MNDKEKAGCSISIGEGFSGLLTIAFVVLKLMHYIDWPWIWVLSPLWISLGLFIGVLLLIGVVLGIILLGAMIVNFVKLNE